MLNSKNLAYFCNENRIYLSCGVDPKRYIGTTNGFSSESVRLRIVHFRCYTGLQLLTRLIRQRIQSETNLEEANQTSVSLSQYACALSALVNLVETSLGTLLQLQDNADVLRSRIRTFKHDPSLFDLSGSWPCLNNPKDVITLRLEPTVSHGWTWPIEFLSVRDDYGSRSLQTLDLAIPVRSCLIANGWNEQCTVKLASDPARLGHSNDQPPSHMLATFESKYAAFDSELLDHLHTAWNLLFGWTWLSIANVLTRNKLKRSSSTMQPASQPDEYDSPTDSSSVQSNSESSLSLGSLRHLVFRMLSIDSRVLTHRLLGEHGDGPMSPESTATAQAQCHNLLKCMRRVFRRLSSILPSMERVFDSGSVDARHVEHSLRRLTCLFQNVHDYRLRFTELQRQGTPRYIETRLEPNMNRTSLYLYVQPKSSNWRPTWREAQSQSNMEQHVAPRPKRSQLCIYCSARTRWTVDHISACHTASALTEQSSINKQGSINQNNGEMRSDETDRLENHTPGMYEKEEGATDSSPSLLVNQVSETLWNRTKLCSVNHDTLNDSSIRSDHNEPDSIFAECSQHITSEVNLLLESKRDSIKNIVDPANITESDLLKVSNTANSCMTVEVASEVRLAECRTHVKLEATSNDLVDPSSTLQINHSEQMEETPAPEIEETLDETTTTSDETIEMDRASVTESVVPELILEKNNHVIASNPVRARPKSSKLGCAEPPMYWYSPALEPITEYSEYSVPTDSVLVATNDSELPVIPETDDSSSASESRTQSGDCRLLEQSAFSYELQSLQIAIDEVASSETWIGTQLGQFGSTDTETFSGVQIAHQLSRIDQLLQLLAPLGARLRNLEQRVEQVWNELPVCGNLTEHSGALVTPAEVSGVTQGESTQSSSPPVVVTSVQCAHSKLSSLREQLQRVRDQRSTDLAHCEQLVADLEQAQNQSGTVSAQLIQIQQDLANVSNRLENPQSDLWGVNLDLSGGGLEEQLQQLTVLEKDLVNRLQPALQHLRKQAARTRVQMTTDVDTVEAELGELIETVRHKLDCLHRIWLHLKQLIDRSRMELDVTHVELVNRLRKLMVWNVSSMPPQSPEFATGLVEELLQLVSEVDKRESTVIQLLDELDQVIGVTAVGPVSGILDLPQGSARNRKEIEQLAADLRASWTNLNTEMARNATVTTIHTVCDWIVQVCHEALMCVDRFEGTRKTSLQQNMMQPDWLQEQLTSVKKHLETLNGWRSWVTQHMEPLICSRSGLRAMQQRALDRWNQTLAQLDYSRLQLETLLEEFSVVILPASELLRERVKHASSFLELLQAQSQELMAHADLEHFGCVVEPDTLNDQSNSEILAEFPPSIQLELARVRRNQVHQLVTTIEQEQQLLQSALTEMLETIPNKSEKPDAAGDHVDRNATPSISTDSNDGNEADTLGELQQSYRELLKQLDAQRTQLDKRIDELEAQCTSNANETEPVGLLRSPDINVVDSDAWESDSGFPYEAMLCSTDCDQRNEDQAHAMSTGPDPTSNHMHPLPEGPLLGEQPNNGILSEEFQGHRSSAADQQQGPQQKLEFVTENGSIDALHVDGEKLDGKSTCPIGSSNSELLQAVQKKCNQFKIRYHSAVRSLVPSDVNKQISTTDYSTMLKTTLTEIQEIINDGQKLMTTVRVREPPNQTQGSPGRTADHETNPPVEDAALTSMNFPISEHYAVSGYVGYEFGGEVVLNKLGAVLDEATEFRERALSASELAERVGTRILRLTTWMENANDAMSKIPCAEQMGEKECLSALNQIKTLRMELAGKMEPVIQLAHEAELLREILEDLTGSVAQNNGDGPADSGVFRFLPEVKSVQEAHSQLMERSIQKSLELHTELIRIGRLVWVTNECRKSLDDCQSDSLLFSEDSLTQSCESVRASGDGSTGVTTNAPAHKAIVTEPVSQAIRLKRLQFQCIELDAVGTVLKAATERLRADRSDSTGSMTPVERDLHQIQLLQHTIAHSTRARCIREQDKLDQLDQLDGALRNQAAWLARSTRQIARLGTPKGLRTETAQMVLSQFEEACEKHETEGLARFVKLIQITCGTISPAPRSLDEAVHFAAATLAPGTQSITGSVLHLYPSGLRQLILQQAKHQRLLARTRSNWNEHLRLVTEHEARVERLCLLLEEISATLSKLYRPSKFVARCTDQLKEVKDVLIRLREQEASVTELAPILPHLKPLCQTGEWRHLLATIRSMKHGFICLVRRAYERQRMLQQAFKEDLQFDRAYHRLIRLLETELASLSSIDISQADSSTLSEPAIVDSVPPSVTDSERATFWAVLRLGGNLRERCTQIDPERGALDQMLIQLRDLWTRCARLKAERTMAQEASLFHQGHHSSAHERLIEWIQSTEIALGISGSGMDVVLVTSLNNMTSPGPQETDSSGIVEVSDPLRIRVPKDLASSGLSLSECHGLTSVFGDETLVQMLRDEHQLLTDELHKRSKLWGLTKEQATVLSPSQFTSALLTRMQRLHVACELRSNAIEAAMVVATQLQESHSHLHAWLSEAERHIQVFECYQQQHQQDGTPRNCSVKIPAIKIQPPPSLDFTEHQPSDKAQSVQHKPLWRNSVDETEFSSFARRNRPSLLNVYEYLRCNQAMVSRGSYASFCSLIERLLPLERSAQTAANGGNVSSAEQVAIKGHCHAKAKAMLRQKYHIILTRWHHVDQRLNFIRVQLRQQHAQCSSELDVCLGLERTQRRIRQWTRQLRQQRPEDIALCAELDEAVTCAAPTHSNSDSSTRLRRGPSVGRANPTDIDTLVRRLEKLPPRQQQWSADYLLSRLEKRFVQALTMQTSVLDGRPEVEASVTAYREAFGLSDRPTKSSLFVAQLTCPTPSPSRTRSCARLVGRAGATATNTSDGAKLDDGTGGHGQPPTHTDTGNEAETEVEDDEMGTLSVLSQASIEFDSGLISPDSRGSHLVDTDSGWHPKPRASVLPITGSISLTQLREQRLEVVETEYNRLVRQVTQRLTDLQRLHEAVSAHIQLKNFDFTRWRENYLQWLSMRHFRLLDLFRLRLPASDMGTVRRVSASRSTSFSIAPSTATAGDRASGSSLSLADAFDDVNAHRTRKQSQSSIALHGSHLDLTSPNSSNGSPTKSVAFGSGSARFKSATSTEHLGTDTGAESSQLQHDLTCSQFVQAVLRDRPEFPGSSPIELRAAFHTIDTTKRGRITYQQLVDALKPERQRPALSVSELIANAIQAETSKCCCASKFLPVRVEDNKYKFGTSNRVYLVRFLNSTTMVRVGGGWMNLTEFLSARDPCRARRKAATFGLSSSTHRAGHLDSSVRRTPPTAAEALPTEGLGTLEVASIRPGIRTPVLSAPSSEPTRRRTPGSFASTKLHDPKIHHSEPKVKPRHRHILPDQLHMD